MSLYTEVAGEGPAVALVHEGICDSRMWDREWQEWSPSFRLLRLDLRGFGRSPLEAGPFAHARDLIAASAYRSAAAWLSRSLSRGPSL